MTEPQTGQIPRRERLPSDPAGLAALIEQADAADDTHAAPELWGQVIEDYGYADGLQLWEAAHRDINARRARGPGAPCRPGDRSTEGLALAQLQFVRAAGIGDARVLRGEFRGGAQAFAADLVFHLADCDRAESVARAFGFGHETTPLPQRSGGTAQLHRFAGEWQDYRVMIESVTEPPAVEASPEDPQP